MKMNCPVPLHKTDHILIGHGGGGKLTQELIHTVFYPAFKNPLLDQDHDGCVFPVEKGRMACSTDSFVVTPIFFPGGDIGDLAVNGTVNDLACCGARPLYLTAGFILEEGLPLEELKRVVTSMRKAADKAGVQIVTGDTKVVERGKCDKLYINTSGIGIVQEGIDIGPSRARPGDVVICSGAIGVHGITILSARESLGFETNLKSDTVSLNNMLLKLLNSINDVHVLRDPTRGGVSGTLNEIAKAASVEIILDEEQLPIPDAVCGASEILGLDPLYIANEGLVLVILPAENAAAALAIMHACDEGKDAKIIGYVTEGDKALVKLKTQYGHYRIIDTLSGEQLPRIC